MKFVGENGKLLKKLSVVAVAMFAFGFALVPFYEQICRVTGINNLLNPDRDTVISTQVDRNRMITVEFDANVHDVQWKFRPLKARMQVHPGEMSQIEYEVTNDRDQVVVGQAVPSYGPEVAGRYFKKIDCFCFTRQSLDAKETKRMPVVFVIDPALPAEVNTITLSYTFFEIAGAVADGQAQLLKSGVNGG